MRIRAALAGTVLLTACASSGSTLPAATTERVSTYIDTGMTGADVLHLESRVEGNITSTHLPLEPDRAWAALLEVQRELDLPVGLVDAGRRITGARDAKTRRILGKRPSVFLDCGRGNAGQYADVYDLYVTRLTEVIPSPGGGSELRTRIEARAQDAAHGNAAIRCSSWRRLEQRIADAVLARANAS